MRSVPGVTVTLLVPDGIVATPAQLSNFTLPVARSAVPLRAPLVKK